MFENLLQILLGNKKQEDMQEEVLTPQQLFKKVIGCVVHIQVITNSLASKYGAGFIYNKEGIILTAHHVIKDANLITVSFYNGKTYSGTLFNLNDEGRDLATVKITPDDNSFIPAILRPITEPLNIGAKLFAIGHPFNQKFSYTEGIVSQIRPEMLNPGKFVIKNAIQTDAALNPGNSGGPAFDKRGRLVGMANLILSPKGVSEGVGYLTPASELQKFASGH